MPAEILAAHPWQEGIHRWDLSGKELPSLAMVPGGHGLAVHGACFYSGHDMGAGPYQASSVINAWRRQGDGWQWLGALPGGGRSPCALAVSPDGKFLAVAHFRGQTDRGCFTVFSLAADGALRAQLARIEREGSGPGPRQTCSHVHSVCWLDAQHLAIADLGTDEVAVYRVSEQGTEPCAVFTAPPGSGPRSLAASASGELLAVTCEQDDHLLLLRWDAPALRLLEREPMLPAQWSGQNAPSDCALVGEWIYAANRGHHSLACFHCSGTALQAQGHLMLSGSPRAVDAVLALRLLVVAVEGSSQVALIPLDAQGAVAGAVQYTPCPAPTCIVVAPD